MVKEGDEVMVTCAACIYKTSRRVIRAIIRPPFFWWASRFGSKAVLSKPDSC